MRGQKSNFSVYSSLPRINKVSAPVNIISIIKKNKEAEKKEKIQKIYLSASFLVLLGIFIIFRLF